MCEVSTEMWQLQAALVLGVIGFSECYKEEDVAVIITIPQ